jgi:hypothetical protein
MLALPVGGVEGLVARAKRHPSNFYGLYARLIPTVQRLEENAAAAAITLSPTTRALLEDVFHIGAAAGDRYDAEGMRLVNT